MRIKIKISIFIILLYVINCYAIEADDKMKKKCKKWLNNHIGSVYQWEYDDIYDDYMQVNHIKTDHKIKAIVYNYTSKLTSSRIGVATYNGEIISKIDEYHYHKLQENNYWIPEYLENKSKRHLEYKLSKIDFNKIYNSQKIKQQHKHLYKKAFEAGWILGLYNPLYNFPIPHYLSEIDDNSLKKIWLRGVKNGYEEGYKSLRSHLKPYIEAGIKYWNETDSLTKELDVIKTAIKKRACGKKVESDILFVALKKDINDSHYHNINKMLSGGYYINSDARILYPMKEAKWVKISRRDGHRLLREKKVRIVLTFQDKVKTRFIWPIVNFESSMNMFVHKISDTEGDKLIVTDLKWNDDNTISLKTEIWAKFMGVDYIAKYEYKVNKWHEIIVDGGAVSWSL